MSVLVLLDRVGLLGRVAPVGGAGEGQWLTSLLQARGRVRKLGLARWPDHR